MSLRILHTESSKGWGGQENRILNELLALRELGHTALLACQPESRLGTRAEEAGFAVTRIRMRGALDVPAILALRRLMRRAAVDVVNTHSGRDTQLAGMAARSLWGGRPQVVRTRHLALPITSHFSYVTLPDHVVTVSGFVGEYLVSAGVPRERITVVHTGIDLSRYQTDGGRGTLRAELGLADDTPLIGTVAILRRKKGHAELLEAVPKVLARFPDCHFVFAGDGPQQQNLEQRIAELGLQDRVHMLGLRRDVVGILQALDVFVLPTHQEALGTAFIEAAAMGLPAIGSDVDGVPEAIIDGETGLLVPVNDSDAIAGAILQLLENPAQRQTMGVAAKARVQAHFSRRAMAQGMVALFERLRAAA